MHLSRTVFPLLLLAPRSNIAWRCYASLRRLREVRAVRCPVMANASITLTGHRKRGDAMSLVDEGIKLTREGRYQEAVQRLQRATEEEPASHKAWACLSDALH